MLSRSRGRRKAAVEARIREAIDGLRPLLRIETSQLALVEFEEETGVAVLRVEGDCPDCRMSTAMLMQGIEVHLRTRVPEIRAVRAVPGAAGEADPRVPMHPAGHDG